MNDATEYRELLSEAARRALQYLEHLQNRRVFPSQEALTNLARLGGSIPERPEDPLSVLKLLDEVGSPATVASTGARHFGIVVAGEFPATVTTPWLPAPWRKQTRL